MGNGYCESVFVNSNVAKQFKLLTVSEEAGKEVDLDFYVKKVEEFDSI